jgi:DNA polymerase-3 subunit delta'
VNDRAEAVFGQVAEQPEAKRLLIAALEEGPAHAYLFHGPPGVGKRLLATAFAGELLGDPGRVERGAHPDLYLVAPLGEQLRVGDVHALRRDLHLRPFEASRRVYIVVGAELLNPDAADALLKSLEEPPSYAVIVLVADQPEMLPPTIASRCQAIVFRRLSRAAVASALATAHPELESALVDRIARLSGGRLDRAFRLVEPEVAERRLALVEVARSVYRDPVFTPWQAAAAVLEVAHQRGEEARDRVREQDDESLTRTEREQRDRRALRGAERESVIESLDLLAGWYRDLLVVSAGSPGAVSNVDLVEELAIDVELVAVGKLERAAEAVRDTIRDFAFQVQLNAAVDALFTRLQRALRSA